MRALVSSARENRSWIAIIAALLVAASLSGCLGIGGDDDDDDDDPDETETPTSTESPTETEDPDPPAGGLVVEAAVVVDLEWGWAGNDTFTFDASNSTVQSGDGEISTYSFDFGDGNSSSGSDAVVEHTYESGGVHLVNVTVEAESDDGEETASDMMVTLALVAAKYDIGAEDLDTGTLTSILLPDDAADEWTGAFNLSAGATYFNATLNITDESDAIDDSQGYVTFEAPQGDDPVMANETFGPEYGDEDSLELEMDGTFENVSSGEHTLRVTLEEGAIQIKGTLEIYYGVDPETL